MAYYKNTQNGKNLNFMTYFFLHSTQANVGEFLKLHFFRNLELCGMQQQQHRRRSLNTNQTRRRQVFVSSPSAAQFQKICSLSYSMFSYFVVVSYPHWFKFCQNCDIKFRIHNYHFFHKQNPIVLSNFLWKNHLWSMDCQRGDAFLDVNLGSVPLCITSWSILSFSCGYILMFPMKMRRKE